MTTNEIAELMLVYLHDKSEAAIHSFFFFSLSEFAVAADISDDAALFEAAQALESEGFVMLSQDISGQISAIINQEGISFVESGGKTGIIGKYRNNPDTYLKNPEDSENFLPQPPVIVQCTREMMRTPATAQPRPTREQEPSVAEARVLILEIMNEINYDPTLDETTREDIRRDVQSLALQFEKTVKNKTIIEAVISELSGVPSIVQLAAQLGSLV